MAKKRGKSVSFDAMVKFFMHAYQIPTKRDIDRILTRLDRIERLLIGSGRGKNRRSPNAKSSGKAVTSSDIVLDVIQRYDQGVGFSEVQLQTGFEEKKLRNIIFRLHKLGKITRKSRGIYQKA